jgi:hypothetical protein
MYIYKIPGEKVLVGAQLEAPGSSWILEILIYPKK